MSFVLPGVTHCEKHGNLIGLGYECDLCEKERKMRESKVKNKMTNREWLLNKMQNMSDEELADLIHVPPKMDEEVCDLLDDCFPRECIGCKTAWLKAEHKEKITLSEAERIILENGNKDFNWIARDKSGALYVYTEKPRKNDHIWENTSRSFELTYFNHLFQFITWNDSKPYNIEELLNNI